VEEEKKNPEKKKEKRKNFHLEKGCLKKESQVQKLKKR